MTSPTGSGAPAVQRQQPPALVLTVFNPIFAAILRSPAHGLVDSQFMLLHVTGRKTGKRHDIVVGRHERDGVLFVLTSAPWRVNARGGSDAEVTDKGVTRRVRAVLVEETDDVVATYASEIERIGWKQAQRRLGVKLNVGRAPTRAELADAVPREHLCVIRLEPL